MSDGREERDEQRARLEEERRDGRLGREGQQEPVDWEPEREDS